MFEFIAANRESLLDQMRDWLGLAANYEKQGKINVADAMMQEAIGCLETHVVLDEASSHG